MWRRTEVSQLALFDDDWFQHVNPHSWRHTSEGGFDGRRYTVAPLDEPAARLFVTRLHYSGSFPAAKLCYALFEDAVRLVGVCVLGIPVQARVLTGPLPTLVPYTQSVELSRLVVLDDVQSNAASFFVARVFDLATAAGVRGIVSFADPMRNHVGILYQALNGTYTGQGKARLLTLLPDGTVLNDRTAQKFRAGERGGAGVVRTLVKFGALPYSSEEPPPGWEARRLHPWLRRALWVGHGEDRRRVAWLAYALDAAGVRRVRHPGNYRYVWALGTRAERRRTPIGMDPRPYPKTPDVVLAA